MARPRKQTVDYFPHDCKHGKTIFALERSFGLTGYAFWWKLLEKLGSTDGHVLDLSDDLELDVFSAEIGVSVTETIDMLGLLSRLNAIDRNLWEKRVIWCQKFVDRLGDVYEKRVVSAPKTPVSAPKTRVSDSGKPQSKVKESKVNKTTEFKKPTIGEIYLYCLKSNKVVDAGVMFDHYEKVGWKTKTGPLRSWKGATTTFHDDSKDSKTVYRAVLRLINDYFDQPRHEWAKSDKRHHPENGIDFLKVYTDVEQFINPDLGLPAPPGLLDLIHRKDFIQYLEQNTYEQDD